MSVEIQPYFAEGERYPALIGVRAEADEYETAYVSKSELVDALAENAKLREKIKALTELASIGKLTASQCTELAEDNAKLRELLQRALTSHNKICTNRGTCAGCLLFKAKPLAPVCPIISVTRDARELGVEVDE